MRYPIDPMLPDPFRIHRVRKETYDTFTLELQPESKENGFSFAPGQFNMLYVFGAGEVPVSISGDPLKADTLFHTTRAVGKTTKALIGLKRGEIIGVRGPFGNPWPVDEAAGNDVVLVAGGIGIAPLRPVIYQIIHNREKYGKILLLYGVRTPHDLLYVRELEQWRFRSNIEVKITVDSAPANWRGNVGVVTTLIPNVTFDTSHATAMICGPEIMMRFTLKEFLNLGMHKKNIFLSMERNMKCGIGFCGHCQFGPTFVCKDGPVFSYDNIQNIFGKREI